MSDNEEIKERQAWVEGAVEYMEKRLVFMERLYEGIDRKLWVLVGLGTVTAIGILGTIITVITGMLNISISSPSE